MKQAIILRLEFFIFGKSIMFFYPPIGFCSAHSVQKGPSLFQHLHIKQSKSPMHSRIHIARQIAQGMGYLHARGIVVGDLNTKAIFLESKVKLCLTGYDTTDGMCDRWVKGRIVTYLLTLNTQILRKFCLF